MPVERMPAPEVLDHNRVHPACPGCQITRNRTGRPARPRPSSTLRVRIGQEEAHYGGNLVEGARVLKLFGNIVTEIAIVTDGDEGLFAGYDKIEFLAPVYAGDFVEATGRVIKTGNTSRTVELEAQGHRSPPRPEPVRRRHPRQTPARRTCDRHHRHPRRPLAPPRGAPGSSDETCSGRTSGPLNVTTRRAPSAPGIYLSTPHLAW